MSPVYIKVRVGKTGKRYLVYWRRGGRAYREEYAGSFKTRKEANARRDLVAGELAAGRDPRLVIDALKTPPVRRAGLEPEWQRFIDSRRDLSDAARAVLRSAGKRWIPILGADTEPHTVTVLDVIDAVADLGDGDDALSPTTVANYLNALAQFLDFADVDPNPARSSKVKLPRRVKDEVEIPTTPAWFRIRRHAKKRSRLASRIMECGGFRMSEVLGLAWGDVDFIDGQIRIARGKTAAARRWVPQPLELLDELADLRAPEDREISRSLFDLTTDQFDYDFGKACVAAGAPGFTSHALRHRRISLWLKHGIDPVQIARWAGHTRSSMSLDVYGHLVVDGRSDEWRDFWIGKTSGRIEVER